MISKEKINSIINIAIKIIISLGIAVGFGWWIESKGIKLIPPKEYFSSVKWGYIVFYLFLLLSFNFFRAFRWYYLLKPIKKVKISKILTISFAGFLAIMFLPLRTGEFARPYFLKTLGEVSMSSGMGTIAVERIMDGLIISLVLTVCLLLLPPGNYPAWVDYAGWLSLALFGVAFSVLILLLIYKEKLVSIISKVTSKISKKLSNKVVHILDGFIVGLQGIPSKKDLIPFVFYTLLYWIFNALSMWELALGCGLDISFIGGMTLMSVLGVGILIPTGPGHFGNFQFSIYLALLLFLPKEIVERQGAVYIFLIYVIQVCVTAILGLSSMFTEHISFKKIVISEEKENTN